MTKTERAKDPSELPPYRCEKHGETEPVVSRLKSGYIHRRCKACRDERFKKREWQIEYRRRKRMGEPLQGREYSSVEVDDPYKCSICGSADFYSTTRANGAVHRHCRPCHIRNDQLRSYSKRRNRSHRDQICAAYGGKCECCSESNQGFLSIDHTRNDGNVHRKKIGGNLYWWLIRENFPKDGFRLLCFNCNIGRARNGGICPHVSVK